MQQLKQKITATKLGKIFPKIIFTLFDARTCRSFAFKVGCYLCLRVKDIYSWVVYILVAVQRPNALKDLSLYKPQYSRTPPQITIKTHRSAISFYRIQTVLRLTSVRLHSSYNHHNIHAFFHAFFIPFSCLLHAFSCHFHTLNHINLYSVSFDGLTPACQSRLLCTKGCLKK